MCLKPRDSLSAETGETPGGKRLREGGTRQCFGALLASCPGYAECWPGMAGEEG